MREPIAYINDWVIEENTYSNKNEMKFESIMAQGNGYLGARNSLEECYNTSVPGLFVTGMFNRFSEEEVTELVNFPNIFQTRLSVNGEVFNMKSGKLLKYSRKMNYENGHSERTVLWKSPQNHLVNIKFKRFISMDNKHLVCQQIEIVCDDDSSIEIISGIDGRVTNSGAQHFEEGVKQYFEKEILQLRTRTTESKIPISLTSIHKLNKQFTKQPIMKRRQLFEKISGNLKRKEKLILEKYTVIYTGRDMDFEKDENEIYLKFYPIEELKKCVNMGYNRLLNNSSESWEKIWHSAPIEIQSKDYKDQLLLNFSRYHLHIMSPVHDNRMNVGAKGLSGEGYKGHTFWDTEIFILPYFSYNYPNYAKNLITYRLNSLEAAKENAKKNGFQGSQYPWEAAWITDGEVTPSFGDIDIVTGKPTPILTGELEHHITGDIVLGASEYLNITKDRAFEKKLFLLFWNCAKFWCTRARWDNKNKFYVIENVIGPDEYKEHVNNNAYTNYLAQYTLKKTIELYHKYFDSLQAQESKWVSVFEDVLEKLYIPKSNTHNILPQDDTYLSKKIINLSKYQNSKTVGTIFLDYNLTEINDIQVSKQADVLLLIQLFPYKFTYDELRANWDYYFPKTLHDSSLSLATHCNYALLLNEKEEAYKLFKKSFDIDLGCENMSSSDDGIHAASMGGIWQNVVFGFGGLKILDDGIRINPKLPNNWTKLNYTFSYCATKIYVTISETKLYIKKENTSNIPISVDGKEYMLVDELVLKY